MRYTDKSFNPRELRKFCSACLLLITLAFGTVVAAGAQSARSEFNQGRDAEAKQDWITAFAHYKKAYEQKPKDIRYRASFERTKVEAGALYIKRGQLLRDQGKLEDALQQFQTAAVTDPSSDLARQEIIRTQQAIDTRDNAQGTPQASAPKRSALAEMVEQAGGPVELAPISEQPITLKMTEDSRRVYETIGKLAGMNVLFDPDYTSRRVSVELTNVSLRQALELVAFESKTFWRPVTSNTIFVAADTQAKRKELEQNVIKTFYLANTSQPTEIQDIVNTLRTILEINRVQQLPSQGAIVVRGTPDQVALAEKLINDIDKARAEVVVDVVVMQIQRDKLRQLGLQPPSSVTVGLTPPNLAGAITGGSSSSASLGSFKNFSPSRNLSVSLPTATANFLFSDSSTKIIQNPQIRALDGQKATLKIGDRVPVATGSFQPGIGGVGINPLVNTQFQYIDVGVNVDITPRVHANHEVTLKVALDVSAVTRTAVIGGIEQPVIGQRKVEHEIRLREGEANLLGGILEQQDIQALSGIPGLAQVPILKYFFASEKKEKVDNEIVFVLIPHIVRSQEVSELNQRAIDVGSANAIELRRAGSTPPPVNPAVAATAPAAPAPGTTAMPVTNAPAAAQPTNPNAAAAPNATPDAAAPNPNPDSGAVPPAKPAVPASLYFQPAAPTVAPGGTMALNVMLKTDNPMHAVSVELQYDPKLLSVLNVSNGMLLSKDGQAVALVHRDDPNSGRLRISAERPPNTTGVAGEGTVFTVTFQAKGEGQARVLPIGLFARDDNNQPMQMNAQQAIVNVGAKVGK